MKFTFALLALTSASASEELVAALKKAIEDEAAATKKLGELQGTYDVDKKAVVDILVKYGEANKAMTDAGRQLDEASTDLKSLEAQLKLDEVAFNTENGNIAGLTQLRDGEDKGVYDGLVAAAGLTKAAYEKVVAADKLSPDPSGLKAAKDKMDADQGKVDENAWFKKNKALKDQQDKVDALDEKVKKAKAKQLFLNMVIANKETADAAAKYVAQLLLVAADEKAEKEAMAEVVKARAALKYADAAKTGKYADIRARWDMIGQLESCTDPKNASAEHTCSPADGENAMACGRLVLSKTVESGDPVSKRYDHVCVKKAECGTSIELEDGKVDITCSAWRLMATTAAALASIAYIM